MEGDVDFTDLGAGTFKSLADLLYGPDFFSSAEVDSDDGQELIYYSVSADQARHIAEEAEKQTPGRVVIVEPIGPWCIFWWKTFASGYRVSVLKKGRSVRKRASRAGSGRRSLGLAHRARPPAAPRHRRDADRENDGGRV